MNTRVEPRGRRSRARAGVTAAIASVALALAVLGTTAPGGSTASAAPSSSDAGKATTVATPRAGEARLGGRFVFTTGPGLWFAVRDPSDPSDYRPTPPGATFVWATWATTQESLGDTSAGWTFPVAGEAGPVSPASDPTSCLDQGPTWGDFGYEVLPCDGSTTQQFQRVQDGTALRDVGTGKYIGTGSTGYDDILQPTASSGTAARIDNSLLTFVPPTIAPAPVRIDTPTHDETVTTRRPVFSGTGEPDASIEITGPMGALASTTVVGSRWSVRSDVDLPDGTYTITVTQRTVDGRVTSIR
jgi:hypothetical protein